MKKTLLLVLLSWMSVAVAYVRPDPCCFGLEVEYLYVKPSIDYPEYVIDATSIFFGGTGTPDGPILSNPLDFQSGYRVQAVYGLDCYSDFRLRWTQLPGCDNRSSTEGPFLYNTLDAPANVYLFGEAGTAESNFELDLYSIEGLYDVLLCEQHCWVFTANVGVRGFYGRYYEDAIYVNTLQGLAPLVFSNRYSSWGIGPEIGVVWNLHICGSIGLSFEAETGVLAARNDAFYKGINNDSLGSSVVANERDIWRLVPFSEFYLGFTYDGCICSKPFQLGIGYEFTTYRQALTFLRFPDDANPGALNPFKSSIDMHGLRLSAGMNF